MRIVCIGAAPTGLGAAYRLHELQNKKEERAKEVELFIIEQEPEAGGLSSSITDEKGFTWDMGVHITYSQNQPYYEKATKWALDEWNSVPRNCMVDMAPTFGEKGIRLVPYPAQFAIPLFPEAVKQACLKELKERYDNPSKETPVSFEDWIMQHFGPTIHEHFLKPYNTKIWTVDPSKMNSIWVGPRVAKLPQEKLEELCSLSQEELLKADFGWGPNANFDYPKRGGTGHIWSSMAKKLPNAWFHYNSKVIQVLQNEKIVRYVDKATDEVKEVKYDILLSAAPADILVKETGICRELNVVHTKVTVVGVGLRKPVTDFLNNVTWLYFSDPNVTFYRATILSTYGDVTPDADKYWSVLCECATTIDDQITEEEMVEKTIDGLVLKSMFTRDQIESVWSKTLPYGYPVPTLERDSEMARAHREFEKYSIYSRGRFGGYKYEASNQDHCFIQGKEFIDMILLNEPEKLYKTGLASKQG